MKDQRYYANPYPTKPAAYPASASASDAAYWMSAAAAQTSPIFVRGCSQFIVEYAGNFLQQNQDASPTNSNFGQITGVGPDPTGKLDFIPVTYVDANGNKIYARQIRWYGFPRDVDGDGNVLAYSGDGAKNLSDYQGSPGHAAPDVPTTFDVVPLYNVIQSAVPALPPKQVMPRPFEQAYPVNYTSMLGPGSIPFNTASTTNPPEANPYVCVWGPGTPAAQMPKMIRIIIGIDDPSGRLNSEQTYEYVFTLP